MFHPRQRLLGLGVLLVVTLGVARPAAARDVYLNGVKLDSSVVIANQNFPACEVRIDERGDVYITAKGFKIDVKPAAQGDGKTTPPAGAAAAPAPAKLEKRYWLVSKQPAGRKGMAQYEVEVFVNGKLVKKVRAADDPVILEVTAHVVPGENRVTLKATKVMGDKRLSSSPTDSLEILLGEGSVGGGTVSITRSLVTTVVTAQDTKNTVSTQRFEGR